MSQPNRAACERLAEREWEATRRSTEPTWDRLSPELRALWTEDVVRFVGRYLALARTSVEARPADEG